MQQGIRIGLAGNERRRQAKEDKKRAEYEEALGQAQTQHLDAAQTEERQIGTEEAGGRIAGQPIMLPGPAGPVPVPDPRVAAQEGQGLSAMERKLHQTRDIASRLSPQHREQFILEQRGRMQQEAMTKARRGVMDGIQDRLATGAYNFEGDTEASPEVESRLQTLVEGLEADRIDPLQAQQVEAQILDAVKKTSQKRLQKQRGNAMVDDELGRAIQAGNGTYSGDLELLKSAWNAGELDFDDLVDRMFEAKHGRKTARSSGPNAMDLREKAIDLAMKAEGKVDEPTVQRYLQLLDPQQAQAPTAPVDPMEQIRSRSQQLDETIAQAEQGRPQPAPGVPRGTPEQQAPPQEGQGGLPDRKWRQVGKQDRAKVQARLTQAMKGGEDLLKVARSLNFDLESLPEKIEKALIAAAKGG